MQGLPSMIFGDGISKKTQVRFGGYNHNPGAADGEIWDMGNLTSDYYPLLSPRQKRWQYNDPNGDLSGTDGLFFKNGRKFLAKDGRFARFSVDTASGRVMSVNPIGDVSEGEKQFVSLGAYIIILPDMTYYNTEDKKYGLLQAEWKGTVSVQNGTYKGENAEANTIYSEGVDWSAIFNAGDGVTLEGWSSELAANNKTIIIREIDGEYLRFYENSFTMPEDGWEEGGISITRKVPEMDFMCENENRLWGCKGNTIYASKPGDPFNWNVFDGVATDSFAVDVGSAGDFTGCISYMGYPCFFKEDHIYKAYGDRPANFQVMGSASLGVAKGSGRSLAVAGETLFYLSRTGITAYTGGIPQSVADAFGDVKYKNAVAGSDGIKYYVSMEDAAGDSHLFVYDTRKNLWHREDGTKALSFAWDDGRLYIRSEDNIWSIGREVKNGQGEGDINSFAEFGDFTENEPNRKGVSKLQLRVELSEGASFKVYIQFDSDGVWQTVKELKADRKKSFYLPIIPRRCDHYRIKVEGKGGWKLHSMVRETYSGSEL